MDVAILLRSKNNSEIDVKRNKNKKKVKESEGEEKKSDRREMEYVNRTITMLGTL